MKQSNTPDSAHAGPMLTRRTVVSSLAGAVAVIIDRHPRWLNVLLVGGGSGHGFKHGPAVGRYVADLLSGKLAKAEPRFALSAHKLQG